MTFTWKDVEKAMPEVLEAMRRVGTPMTHWQIGEACGIGRDLAGMAAGMLCRAGLLCMEDLPYVPYCEEPRYCLPRR